MDIAPLPMMKIRRATHMQGIPARAFTLIELVVSMAIMVVLLTGISSALVLVSRAVPDEDGVFRTSMEAADLVQQMVVEVHTAKAVTNRSTRSITFQVEDRDTNGVDETIAYEWSGTPGDPIKRGYNNTTANVASHINSFQLSFATTIVSGRQRLLEMRIVAQVGSDTGPRYETTVQLLNAPDVTAPPEGQE